MSILYADELAQSLQEYYGVEFEVSRFYSASPTIIWYDGPTYNEVDESPLVRSVTKDARIKLNDGNVTLVRHLTELHAAKFRVRQLRGAVTRAALEKQWASSLVPGEDDNGALSSEEQLVAVMLVDSPEQFNHFLWGLPKAKSKEAAKLTLEFRRAASLL